MNSNRSSRFFNAVALSAVAISAVVIADRTSVSEPVVHAAYEYETFADTAGLVASADVVAHGTVRSVRARFVDGEEGQTASLRPMVVVDVEVHRVMKGRWTESMIPIAYLDSDPNSPDVAPLEVGDEAVFALEELVDWPIPEMPPRSFVPVAGPNGVLTVGAEDGLASRGDHVVKLPRHSGPVTVADLRRWLEGGSSR